eukprot:2207630-Lingulodinium_polyedra.AAC.1
MRTRKAAFYRVGCYWLITAAATKGHLGCALMIRSREATPDEGEWACRRDEIHVVIEEDRMVQ